MRRVRSSTHRDMQKERKRYCRFVRHGMKHVDYKNPDFLAQFVNEFGRILPKRVTGTSVKYQKKVSRAIKRARHLGLLPFVRTHSYGKHSDGGNSK